MRKIQRNMGKKETITARGTKIRTEYSGLWETLCNPDFKSLEFEGFRQQAGLNVKIEPENL
jgi:hypothetical protein